MIIGALLLSYALMVGCTTRLLRRSWVFRAPRLAIVLWQLALATMVAATMLGLLALGMPTVPGSGLAEIVHACFQALRDVYRSPTSERLLFLLAFGLTAALIARIGGCLITELWRAARHRRRHLRALTLLGRADSQLGVTILDHARPAAYCVPGRGRRIVLTSATLAALDADQLAQVLRHERAHLAGRHDLILVSASALAQAIPLPVFSTAARELGTLVEMLADDAARTPQQRITLAAALVAIATGEPITPASVLAAAATAVLARVTRLVQPTHRLPRTATVAAAVCGGLVALAPVVIVLAPVVVSAVMHYCPVSEA